MKVFLTGGRGYVGGALASEFGERGWEVVMPPRGWRMPSALEPGSFIGVDALVHAAWDMRPSSALASAETNIDGSRRLVEAAVADGVRRLVFISSMSAFEGCCSVYGRQKHDVEQVFQAHGGIAVRPGLVFGDSPGGMLGKLRGLVERLPLIPLPSANAKQFLIHETDLANYVSWATAAANPPDVCSVANPTPMTMRQIVRSIALEQGRHPFIVAIPWRIAFWGLEAAKMLGLSLPVTSDNLVGLARANPAPDFRPLADSPVAPRVFGSNVAR